MLKVLVADDESLARDTVKLLLSQIPYVGEVIEASNGNEALALSHQALPDIAILDIEMPGASGLELAQHLPKKCVVIFATAHNDYALKAFELSAADYVLKPYEDGRFLQAFERATERFHQRGMQHYPILQDALSKSADTEKHNYRDRLVIRDTGRIRLIDVDNIHYIRGAGNYAELHLSDDSTVLHRETLCTLEEQLDPSCFVRIHRSSIVRRNKIVELRPNDKGDYLVLLENGDTLTLSRRNRTKLEEITH
ncbi:LytR/AlgR family response regulator transcription factor [Ningiella sp. W23]|uniref:LytR/AlgR family response regulator transcription factor n=1 Tax=Ningiella sp. W23 TaxID=3023715 RepID=UPI003757E254